MGVLIPRYPYKHDFFQVDEQMKLNSSVSTKALERTETSYFVSTQYGGEKRLKRLMESNIWEIAPSDIIRTNIFTSLESGVGL